MFNYFNKFGQLHSSVEQLLAEGWYVRPYGLNLPNDFEFEDEHLLYLPGVMQHRVSFLHSVHSVISTGIYKPEIPSLAIINYPIVEKSEAPSLLIQATAEAIISDEMIMPNWKPGDVGAYQRQLMKSTVK